MISVNTFTIDGKAAEKRKLPAEVFEVKTSSQVLAQSVRVYLGNQRAAGAKTKTRSEVAKTTAKMFKQKGTGNARHGSYAAPIFVGGGIAFGPTGEQNYTRTMTKSATRKAILGGLSIRAAENKLVVIDGVDKASGKTRDAAALLKQMDKEIKGSVLVLGLASQKQFLLGFRNIENVTALEIERVNAYQIMAHANVILSPEVIERLQKLYVD